MINLSFEKLYNTDRIDEPCYIGFPIKKGKLKKAEDIVIKDKTGKIAVSQSKATSLWQDGTVKWVFTRFNADILKNKSAEYICCLNETPPPFEVIKATSKMIKTDFFEIQTNINSGYFFKSIKFNGKELSKDYISCPKLSDGEKEYLFMPEKWDVIENGAVCLIITCLGFYKNNDLSVYKGEVTFNFYKNKPWFEMSTRIINTSDNEIKLSNWNIECNTLCNKSDNIITSTAQSNTKTVFETSELGERLYREITAQTLMFEANEHNPEVFYGTFFANVTNKTENIGLCTTIFQAQQNFPKAIKAEKNKLTMFLVPEEKFVIMQKGMAITQRMLFHFHNDISLKELNNRSIIYQMPDRPIVSPEVFEKSGVFPNIFTKNKKGNVEIFLIGKADEHSRAYGMMNWGDSPDLGYTAQGRGNGNLVWTNNEYDFPHSSTLLYARTGIRRFLDYVIVMGRHWQDVDICHYSDNPLELNGQYEHTNGHSINGKIVCSHQWVEGLFDYYHLTGEKKAYNAAIKIAENVIRILDTPQFKVKGETSARETGWALRTLTAVYIETNDEKWLEKCDFIVEHFAQWEKEQGHWLSSYMDNVSIRVVFMISIAIGSLMRYNKVKPSKNITDMIIRSVDDLIENCILDNGLFYYKELPSLKRLGNNPIILEALAIAYEITKDLKYLKAGIPTFKYFVQISSPKGFGAGKKIMEDSVITGNVGTKSFAQLMLPVTLFYTYANENKLIEE